MGKSALLLDYPWCMKVLREGKTWEIRSRPCKKRGRIVIASTGKTSPNGKALQLGEATVTDCIVVGRKREGLLSAPVEAPANFLLLDQHVEKHQIRDLQEFPALAAWETVFAWVLENPIEYTVPLALTAKHGCVVWAKAGHFLSRSTRNHC